HSQLIRENIHSVFAEARWNRSVSASVKSGLRVPVRENERWLLTNHVCIGNDFVSDPPDPWNADKPMLQGHIPGATLRSFAVAHLDSSLFTDHVLDTYL